MSDKSSQIEEDKKGSSEEDLEEQMEKQMKLLKQKWFLKEQENLQK